MTNGLDWDYGYYFSDNKGHYIVDFEGIESCIISDTQGQYIGLSDISGQYIYEGDIILSTKYPNNKKGIIVYDVETSGFKIEWITKTDYNNLINVRIDTIRIIGNIHQNRELLNNGKET